jgi:hypothetical protein
VFAAYPDASFELISIGDTGGGLAAYQWLARATNSGPGPDGTPPTGRSVRVSGASFVQVEGDKIRQRRCILTGRTWINSSDDEAEPPASQITPPGKENNTGDRRIYWLAGASDS